MMTREEKLHRIRAGLPIEDDRGKHPSGQRASTAAIRVNAARMAGASSSGAGRNFELSDRAANLIAQALKTLLNS